MDSYPLEFTGHHLPLMFVAGLSGLIAESKAPVAGTSELANSGSVSVTENDPFAVLADGLRKAFTLRQGLHVWDNSRGVNNSFYTLLVDKHLRFPPMKARAPTTTQQPPAPLHSPISPLTPSSPMYPDGIIAPIWIRKHRDMIPSVFILVLRLVEYEFSSAQPSAGPLEKEEEEARQDAELVREIADRKRTTIERGIKLAVVLLCSRELLDDPVLDNRLSLIRRQAGLDSRASLFVISPVPPAEILNFVSSLRAELFPAALDYYREHGRRVRRKRARQVPKGKLSEKGWIVRYDYKMGLFSEMRGEMEVALKHYEDSYNVLVDMFSSPTLLAPRTKRWAEAKVLADCISVKVSKMYLYLIEPSRALAQLNKHISRFRELSSHWGIGEQTFEFWSWLSKQYRLFGDLTSIAVRAGFRLPSLRPPPAPKSVPAGMPQPPSPGLIPLNVLQHAGYYYYLAATCAEERRDRFRKVVETEKAAAASNGSTDDPPSQPSQAVVHESKVNHAELIVDLYRKAYEFFKVQGTSRLSLYVASSIANAHFAAGNLDLALKQDNNFRVSETKNSDSFMYRLYERISRTYRRECWLNLLMPTSKRSYDCSMAIGDSEIAVRALLEIALAPGVTESERSKQAGQLLHVLRTTEPPSSSPIVVEMTEEMSLFDYQASFWSSEISTGQLAPFQVTLSSPPTHPNWPFFFNSLSIYLNDESPVAVVSNTASNNVGSFVKKTQLGLVTTAGVPRAVNAHLDGKDGCQIFQGHIESKEETDLVFSKGVVKLSEGAWNLDFVFRPPSKTPVGGFKWYLDSSTHKSIPIRSKTPSICCVRHPKIAVNVEIVYEPIAYLNEAFMIHIDVRNDDQYTIEVSLDMLLQPGEDESPNYLSVEDSTYSSFVEGVPIGNLGPGTKTRKTFALTCVGSAGDRHIDLSIRCQSLDHGEQSSSMQVPRVTEVVRSLSIPASNAFLVNFDMQYHKRRLPLKPLLDFSEPDGFEGSADVTLIADIRVSGLASLSIEGLQLLSHGQKLFRVKHSSVDDVLVNKMSSLSLDSTLRVLFQLDVRAAMGDQVENSQSAVLELVWRRHGIDGALSFLSVFPLPHMRHLPLKPSFNIALPPVLVLHRPTSLNYRLSNPTFRLLKLVTQVDSVDGFVFAGPRKFPLLHLAPNEEVNIPITVIPLLLGQHAIPRLRAFLQLEVQEDPGQDGQFPQQNSVKTQELALWEESDVEEMEKKAQVTLEDDLRQARGYDAQDQGHGTSVSVLVVPR